MSDATDDIEFRIPEELKRFATEKQASYIDAINLHGSGRKAAAALGVTKDILNAAVRAVRKKAALRGWQPTLGIAPGPKRIVPEPYILKGFSILTGRDGEEKLRWTKTALDNDRREEMIRAAADAMAADIPRLEPIPRPAHSIEHLLNLITLTDVHIGMLAWHREGGYDWDLKIAERTLIGCFEQMILSAPKARRCIVNIQGDTLHYDGKVAVTPTNQYPLDADGRQEKMVDATIRITRRLLDLALMGHEEVRCIIAEGNHDISGSLWLRKMFAALYEREPRLSVNDSALPYYCEQFGVNMLAFHHGHLKKNDQLPLLFAAQFPQIWGMTTKRYCHTGHRHHVEEKEHSGMTVIQHPTLAARDAHASRHGWISERQATAITYHERFGQVARTTVTPEMLLEAA